MWEDYQTFTNDSEGSQVTAFVYGDGSVEVYASMGLTEYEMESFKTVEDFIVAGFEMFDCD